MRGLYWIRARSRRLIPIGLAICFYLCLVVLDVLSTPDLPLFFGSSVLIAAILLALGTCIWLYAYDRRVALILLFLCCTAMTPFVLETASTAGNQAYGIFASVSSSLALLFCFLLFLFFPKPLISSLQALQDEQKNTFRKLFIYILHLYRVVVPILCCVAVLAFIIYPLNIFATSWLKAIANSYTAIVLSAILVEIFISYNLLSSPRDRQQMNFLLGGVLFALTPFLLLTVLPTLITGLQNYSLDATISTVPIVLLPLSLGFSILRYQILIFDTYIRRTATWVVGAISLSVVSYLVVAVSSLIFVHNILLHLFFIAGVVGLLSPFVWWLAKAMTERLFFSEMLHYRRLIEKPILLASEALSMDDVSQLLTLSATYTFETLQACLFVLDETSGYYRLSPQFKDDTSETRRFSLLGAIWNLFKPSAQGTNDWFSTEHPLAKRLAASHRPLLSSEIIHPELQVGLRRYLKSEDHWENQLLFAAARAQGKMIGVLVLGGRGDGQPYAGPDLEGVQLLLGRFSPLLETARLYTRASQHATLLNNLYLAGTEPSHALQSSEEVAATYARVVANSVIAQAEIWLYAEQDHCLWRVTSSGWGPSLLAESRLALTHDYEPVPYFYDSSQPSPSQEPTSPLPFSLEDDPLFPFVWLPLQSNNQLIGVLLLSYPRPHFFQKEEIRVLEMFASQCAVALLNARITNELRVAYERQKELDLLKDQFIVTASHELRTPLTAIQGYIELLREYNTTLSPELRESFIAKAYRGCEELSLMVGNITDAGRVHADVESVKLQPISLLHAVMHVTEILEALTRREGRTIIVAIAPDLLVQADQMRLRQVLLNLLSNAFKYSPVGTRVEVSASMEYDEICVRVRDYGAGIPPHERHRLFERFFRLERDMNSSVRGAGLGLYISKQLIEAMGGRIWVESSGEVGTGSVFAFILQAANTGQRVTNNLTFEEMRPPLPH